MNRKFVKDVLSLIGDKGVLINGKASDIVVKREGRIFAVIAERNASRIKRGKVGVLNALAKAIDAIPLIVSEKMGSEKLLEDVIYERFDTPVASPETLNKLLSGDKIYIRKHKSAFVVSVNPKELKRKRVESGMSLGALADYLGVSKKSVYDYERGESKVSVDVAVKLVELFGEEVLEEVNFNEFEGVIEPCEPHSPIEAKLLDRTEGVHVPKGNVHVGKEREFVAVVPHGDEELQWFGEASKMIDKKAFAVGFEDLPKDLEGGNVEIARDIEEFVRLLREGKERDGRQRSA
ncbi:hypothetical protein EYM_02095 [Ignicoccus islandicus DSM 13165]|uniref:Putative HTH-type transcriptional regulatory protein EYM_02095 n=1 Tax=Ignicoccus islandicus DSM 13165 TaxID=940295 RepID=A0A0U3G1T3_9CREN|nr:helix-turn-helix domain-containing protein [Ignicoccus islandicus]ALU12284.1 hypothetical protein EYM_02095 [Ignicoccus islandicus DSM 13165]